MPRARYSRIKQAQKAFNQLEELIEYEKGNKPSIGPGIGNGASLGNIIPLYLLPFNRPLPTNFYARTRGRSNTFNEWTASFGDHLFNSIDPATDTSAPLEAWTPAKIKMITGGTTPTVQTSGITGRQYLKYNKSSRQLSFGQSDADDTETEATAFSTIRAALQSTNTGANILHIPEKA